MSENILTTRRKTQQIVQLCPKEEKNASLKKVSQILQKSENERTSEDELILTEYSEVVADLKMRWHRRDEAKRRLEEIEEPPDVIEAKCRVLVEAIVKSEHLVVYTGAGISTAARIPDYRGSNGIWTRLQQGKDIGNHDLSLAEPTVTHMALAELYKKKILKYVVSQNCDGLHLRSGLPRTALSELHGNMYIEVCKNCKPAREYWRTFDVTENTARYAHKTMRRCYTCNAPLTDTIVHFGERGVLPWPLNWPGACKNADSADTIICLGSSLKVLKKYPHLWQMNKPAKKRPNLFIVNLQWTPKDDGATLKINGKCDDVIKIIMKYLGMSIPEYKRDLDPIFSHFTPLHAAESHTTNQPNLTLPKSEIETETDTDTASNFTIDNILSRPQQLPTSLINYYLNLNFLSGLYPFQTSLLYSGLHNIINPSFQTLLAKCDYCWKNHQSFTCLFYEKHDAVYKKMLYRLSKKTNVNKELVCVCCDYTTDEDSGGGESETENDPDLKKIKIEDAAVAAATDLTKSKIQAGWFGKGYKKNRKNKKRNN